MDAFGLECGGAREKYSSVQTSKFTDDISQLRRSFSDIERKLAALLERVGNVEEANRQQTVQFLDQFQQVGVRHVALAQQSAGRLDLLQTQLDAQASQLEKVVNDQVSDQHGTITRDLQATSAIVLDGFSDAGSARNPREFPVALASNNADAERFKHILEDLDQEPLEGRLARMQEKVEERVEGMLSEISTPLQALLDAEQERKNQTNQVPVLANGSSKAYLDARSPSAKIMKEATDQEQTMEESSNHIASEMPVVLHSSEAATSHYTKNQTRPSTGSVGETYMAHSLDNAHAEYEISSSIWDAALLLGVKPMGKAASLQLLLLLLCNIAVQVIYTSLINSELTDTNFDDDRITGLWHFRKRVAHDYKWQDAMTGGSLAARLCAADDSLEMASSQSDALSDINGYLPQGSDALFGELTGQTMCILALIVWSLTATKEVRMICKTFIAVLLKVIEDGDGTTKIHVIGEKWVIASFCKLRLSVIVVVLLLRLFITGFLLQAGIQFLVHTIQLEDLVLNAVALECILQLDELIFDALAPTRVVALLDHIEPLPVPQLDFFGIDCPTISGLVLVTSTVCFAAFHWMAAEVNQLKKARHALCFGEKNFVYTDTLMAPFLQWAYTPETWATGGDEVSEDVIFRIASGDTSYTMVQEAAFPESRLTAWSVQSARTWPMESWTFKMNPGCYDLLDVPFNFITNDSYVTLMNARFPAEVPVKTCAKLSNYCDADTRQGMIARSVCPQTCGCNRPWSHLAMGFAAAGCPPTCMQSVYYQQARNTTPCVDMNWTVLSTHPAWLYLANQIWTVAQGKNNTGRGWPRGGRDTANVTRLALLGMLGPQGCASLDFLPQYGIDLCSEDIRRGFPIRSYRLFCPQTCTCTRDMPSCPLSCPAPFGL